MQSTQEAYEETNRLFDGHTQYESPSNDSPDVSPKKSSSLNLVELANKVSSPMNDSPLRDINGRTSLLKDYTKMQSPTKGSPIRVMDSNLLQDTPDKSTIKSAFQTHSLSSLPRDSLQGTIDENNHTSDIESSDCESEVTTPKLTKTYRGAKRKRLPATPAIRENRLAHTPTPTASGERKKRRRVKQSPGEYTPSSGKKPSESRIFQREIAKAMAEVQYDTPITFRIRRVKRGNNLASTEKRYHDDNTHVRKNTNSHFVEDEAYEESTEEDDNFDCEVDARSDENLSFHDDDRDGEEEHELEIIPRKKPSLSRQMEMEIEKAKRGIDSYVTRRLRDVRKSIGRNLEASSKTERKSSGKTSKNTSISRSPRLNSTKSAEYDVKKPSNLASHVDHSELNTNSSDPLGNESEINIDSDTHSESDIPKKSLRNVSHIFEGMNFVVSLGAEREKNMIAAELYRGIRENSGNVLESDDLMSMVQSQHFQIIFVQNRLTSTVKSLIGQAMMYPIVHPDYIFKCIEKGKFLIPIPKDFILNKHSFEGLVVEFYPSDHNYRLFSNFTFTIASQNKQFINNWKTIALASGANVDLILPTTNEQKLHKQLSKTSFVLLDEKEAPANTDSIKKCCLEARVCIVRYSFLVHSISKNEALLNKFTEVTSYGPEYLSVEDNEASQVESKEKIHGGSLPSNHQAMHASHAEGPKKKEHSPIKTEVVPPINNHEEDTLEIGSTNLDDFTENDSMDDSSFQEEIELKIVPDDTPVNNDVTDTSFLIALSNHLQNASPEIFEQWKAEYTSSKAVTTIIEKKPTSEDTKFALELVQFLQKDTPTLYHTWKCEYAQDKSFSSHVQKHTAVHPIEEAPRISRHIQELKPIRNSGRLIEIVESPIREDDIGMYYKSIKVDGKVYSVNDAVFFNPGSKVDLGVIRSIRVSQFGDELSVFEYQRFLTFEEAKKQGMIKETPSQEEYHTNELFLTESRLSLRLERVVCQAQVLCPRLAPSEVCDFHFCRRKIVNKSIIRLTENDMWNGFLSSYMILDKEPERVENRDHYSSIAIHGVQIFFGLWVFVRGVHQVMRKFMNYYAIVDDIFRVDGFVYIQFRKCTNDRGTIKALEDDDAIFVLAAHQIIDIHPLTIVNQDESLDYIPRLTKKDFSQTQRSTIDIYNQKYTDDIIESGFNQLRRRVRVIPFSPPQ